MISVFSLHLVKIEQLPIELGRSLNKVEDIRLMADYLGKEVELEKAGWLVQQAETFVEAIDKWIVTGGENLS